MDITLFLKQCLKWTDLSKTVIEEVHSKYSISITTYGILNHKKSPNSTFFPN